MVGCCGQREPQDKGNCGAINGNNGKNKCIPGANGGNGRGKKVSSQHDEEICHGTGERRRDLLDQIKIYLSEFDSKPCTVTPRPDDQRALGSYPEYLKKHCQSWMHPNPRPPLITSVQTHEIRATSDYKKMVPETNEFVSFKDATLEMPIFTCACVKRNGLQDQCPHPMCKPPTAQCKATNPGPCCPPSLGLPGPEVVLKGKDKGGQGLTVGQFQGTGRTEYQDAYSQMQGAGAGAGAQVYDLGMQEPQSGVPQTNYATTYRQDYQGHQQQQQWQPQGQQQQWQPQGQQQWQPQGQQPLGYAGGFGLVPQPPPGMEMACACKAPSSALPSGKKYLCIPLPPQ